MVWVFRAEQSADGFAIGYALHGLALGRRRESDYPGVLALYDRALDAVGTDVETTDLRLVLTGNRANALHEADRLVEGRQALRDTLRLAERAAPARLTVVRPTAASLWY